MSSKHKSCEIHLFCNTNTNYYLSVFETKKSKVKEDCNEETSSKMKAKKCHPTILREIDFDEKA